MGVSVAALSAQRFRCGLHNALKSFHTAERTLEGIEAMNLLRKGQVKRLSGNDATGQAKFVIPLFQLAAERNSPGELSRSNLFFATQPPITP
jgi:hypothetical protein